MRNLPHGILDICRNTTELSIQKVELWLKSYMFTNDADKDVKSAKVANWLGTASNHKTHGRPIPIAVARAEGLKVVDLESDPDLQDKVLSVFHSAIVSIEVTSCIKIIENQNGKGTFIQFNKQ